MDDFLNLLIKKSDILNNEYFNYKQRSTESNQKATVASPKTEFITEPETNTYIVIDFETTGMNPAVNKIIEIGAVKVIDGKITDKFDTLINPEQFIPSYISSKVHITNKMVADKKTIEEVMPDFMNFISDFTLIAHNASFDMSFLKKNAERLGFTVCNPVIDTLKLSRKYNKECEKHNLGYLTSYFNIDLKNAHRAYFDALATHKLYQIIRNKTV